MQVQKLLRRLFSFEGEASRKEYGLVLLSVVVVINAFLAPWIVFFWKMWINSIDYSVQAAYVMAEDIQVMPGYLMFLWHWLMSIFVPATVVALFFTTIRRLSDLSLSSWWVMALYLPCLNLFFILFLLLKRKKNHEK